MKSELFSFAVTLRNMSDGKEALMCDTRPRDTYRHAGKPCARAGLHLAAVAACHSGKSFCLFNVLWMPSSVARKLPQEHANGRQCMCIKSASFP